jgi:hypothetical protein
MTSTLDADTTPDLVDDLEVLSIAARYTCPSCGRIKCKCGGATQEVDAKSPKAMAYDLSEEEHALGFDQWVELHGYPTDDDRANPPVGAPWYSDTPVESIDDWPWGAPVIPDTPGYLPDSGRPNRQERTRMAAGWHRRVVDQTRRITSQVRTWQGVYDVTRQGNAFACSCGVDRCVHIHHTRSALEDVV